MAENKKSAAGYGFLIIGAIVTLLFIIGFTVNPVRIGVGCVGNPYFATYQDCFNLESQGFHSTKDAAEAKDARSALAEANKFSDVAIAVVKEGQDGARITQTNPNGHWSNTSDYERAMVNRGQYCEHEFFVTYSTEDRRWTWLANAKTAATRFGVVQPSPPPGNQDASDDSPPSESDASAPKPHRCLDGRVSVQAPHDPRDYSGYDGPENK